jgi:tRNA (guanosine-2'-O-)-methyltransferase
LGRRPHRLAARSPRGRQPRLSVELAEAAIRLADLPAARQRTIVVLGHEQTGLPPDALDLLDDVVEIR